MIGTVKAIFARLSLWIVLLLACCPSVMMLFSCDSRASTPSAEPTLDPEPLISELAAIEIAKEQLASILEDVDDYGYETAQIRVGEMHLRKLQTLTDSDLYSEDSPRLNRQIWAIQIDAHWPHDSNPYTIPFGYGIVGIDALNGDIWLRGRFDRPILVEE